MVRWSSLKEGSCKRSHDLLSTLSEPPLKKIKTRKNDDDTPLLIISENEKSVINEDVAYNLQHSEISDVETDINPPLDLSPIITKLKYLCYNNACLNDEQITLLWEELASVQTDQVYNYVRSYIVPLHLTFKKVWRVLTH